MLPEDRELANELIDDSKAVIVGDQVTYAPLSVGGRSFHFDAIQIRFLYALQKYHGNLEMSCRFVGQDMEWAKKFLTSRKFREFRNSKLASLAVRNGDLVDWWWQMGLDGAKGLKEWYEGLCALCGELNLYSTVEVDMSRNDDMSIKASCKMCMQPVVVEMKEEEFKPSREQVQFWGEIGNRLVPKIERVHHEFENSEIVFETK